MLKALRYFWKEQPIALSAFVIAMALLLFFGGRFVMGFLYFQDPAHRNQALEPWMTPKYVGMSWKLPPHVLDDAMGLQKFEGRRVKLDEVADRLGVTMAELEARVRAAKTAHEASKGKGKEAREAREADKRMRPGNKNDGSNEAKP